MIYCDGFGSTGIQQKHKALAVEHHALWLSDAERVIFWAYLCESCALNSRRVDESPIGAGDRRYFHLQVIQPVMGSESTLAIEVMMHKLPVLFPRKLKRRRSKKAPTSKRKRETNSL